MVNTSAAHATVSRGTELTATEAGEVASVTRVGCKVKIVCNKALYHLFHHVSLLCKSSGEKAGNTVFGTPKNINRTPYSALFTPKQLKASAPGPQNLAKPKQL